MRQHAPARIRLGGWFLILILLFTTCCDAGRHKPKLRGRSTTGIKVLVVNQLTGEPVPLAAIAVITGELQTRGAVHTAALLNSKSLSDMAASFGNTYRCGPDGVVFIRPPMEYAVIMAQSGRAYGETDLNGLRDAEPIVVEVRERPTLRARVLDASGVPQANVPVSVWARPLDLEPVARGRSNQQGLVSFEHLDAIRFWGRGAFQVMTSGGGLDENDGPIYLTIDMPRRQSTGTWLNTLRLPSEPVDIILRRGGSVRIKVEDYDGESLKRPVTVALWSVDLLAPGTQTIATDPSGTAHFPRVGLNPRKGVYFANVIVPFGQTQIINTTVEIPAPKIPGEQISYTIRLKHQCPILSGLITDCENQPLRNARVGFKFREGDSNDGSELPTYTTYTDQNGRYFVPLNGYLSLELSSFLDPVDRDEKAQAWQGLNLEALYRDARGIQHGILPTAFAKAPTPGLHQVATTLLKRANLLAQGQVIDPDGNPLVNARVWFQFKDQDPQGKDWWRESDYRVAGRGLTDDNGHFAIHSPRDWSLDETPIRVAVRSTGYTEHFSDPINPGTELPLEDLSIVMRHRPKDWIIEVKLPAFAAPTDYYSTLFTNGRINLHATARPTLKPNIAEIRFHGVSDLAILPMGSDAPRVYGPLGYSTSLMATPSPESRPTNTRHFTADFSHYIIRELSFHTKSGNLIPVPAIDISQQARGSSWKWPADRDGTFRFPAAPGALRVSIWGRPMGYPHLADLKDPNNSWSIIDPKARITLN